VCKTSVTERRKRWHRCAGIFAKLRATKMSDSRDIEAGAAARERPRAIKRSGAFVIHIFTALGAGLALMALLEAVREHWANMFGWLGVALVVDALDGPMARRFDVAGLLPNWSGETLDLVVDFATYVFVPAYAIAASGLFSNVIGAALGIAVSVSGALYFADRRMKTTDNHFRGFPTLWNAAAFYLFLLRPSPLIGASAVILLVVATFLPIHVIHPVRVQRWRRVNLAIVIAWGALVLVALWRNFEVPWPVTAGLIVIAAYMVASDAVWRVFNGGEVDA
jgi:phosphatidylcholine synthase